MTDHKILVTVDGVVHESVATKVVKIGLQDGNITTESSFRFPFVVGGEEYQFLFTEEEMDSATFDGYSFETKDGHAISLALAATA